MTERAIRHGRRGMATMIILLLLAVTLSVAYGVLRSQSTVSQTQTNSNLDSLARQAAVTGCSVALRKMSETNWAGVTSTVSASLDANTNYVAYYQTGDPTLSTSSPNASDWPWRVTIISTGTAIDRSRPTIASSAKVQAVVKLVPRQLSGNPSTLTTALGYTVYQYGNDVFQVEVPCRVTGPVRLQGDCNVATVYPPNNYGLSRYLGDLNTMRTSGYGDWRPVNGPVNVPNNRITGSTRSLLTSMGVSTLTISSTTATGWNFPGVIASYQLYPGGSTYTATIVGSSVSNTTLKANPRTNPLGLFYRSGSVSIGNNVTITGSLVLSGDLTISGTNVSIQPATLPSLLNTTTSIQLPSIIASGNLRVNSGASAVIRGLVAIWNGFDVVRGSSSTSLDFKGRMVCLGFAIEERSDWDVGKTYWSLIWSWFNSQLSPPSQSTTQYYPVWCGLFGLSPTPILTVEPETGSVTYQWKDATNKVFVPGSSDPGLSWSVLSWTEDF